MKRKGSGGEGRIREGRGKGRILRLRYLTFWLQAWTCTCEQQRRIVHGRDAVTKVGCVARCGLLPHYFEHLSALLTTAQVASLSAVAELSSGVFQADAISAAAYLRFSCRRNII